MMTPQYQCVGCRRVVEIPTHAVLTPRQKMNIQKRVCAACSDAPSGTPVYP